MSVRLVVVTALLASIAGCGERRERASKVETTTVPCVVPIGTPIADGAPPLQLTLRGPGACARALELFLRENPDLRVGSILPIQLPVAPDQRQGTQQLVVVHAARGPWPRAGELRVDGPATVCVSYSRPVGEPMVDAARYCAEAIAFVSAIPEHEPVFLVMLTVEENGRVETTKFISVIRRG